MVRLVSATWPESVRQLASTFQRDPYRITVGSEELTANGRVEQGEAGWKPSRDLVDQLDNLLQLWRYLTTHDQKSELKYYTLDGTADTSVSSRLQNHLRILLPKNTKATNSRVLVFALYKAEASRLTQTLERSGYSVSSLHGSLSQPQRIAALEDFKSGRTRLMVATDVAARGLDIPEVEVVINYTFPLKVEDYVHRIGRTGE
jgi:ATP-dependent RNA helicase DBP3